MTVQHWAGRITTEIIQQTTILSWAAQWLQRADNAEQRGNELVVFEVPQKGFSQAVGMLEKELQNEFELMPHSAGPGLEEPINLSFLHAIMMPSDGA
jgi:hypothetical protein